MPLSTAEQAALDRLRSYYEGDNPYNSVTNPGGFRQGGHLYNFVPALKDLAVVIVGAARLATEVAANSVQSPKAVRVDSDQAYTAEETARGRANLGLGTVLADFVKKSGDTMSGNLTLLKSYPAINFQMVGGTYDGGNWSPFMNDGDGNFYVTYKPKGGSTVYPAVFGRDGAFNTSQIGDLNTRIEARGAAYGALRVAKTGDTMTGNLMIDESAGGAGNDGTGLRLRANGGASDWRLRTINGNRLQICDGGISQEYFRFHTDGSLYTLQLGDLNTRIETRATAIADNRLTTARSELMPKTGGDFSGNISSPGILARNGASGVNGTSRLVPGSDTAPGYVEFLLKDGSRTGYVGWSNGSKKNVIASENGWGYDFTGGPVTIGGAGIYTTANFDPNSRVSKAGDTMSGQLVIKYNYPGLELRANDAAGFPYIDFVNEASQNVDYCWRLLTYGKSGDGFIIQNQAGALGLSVQQSGSVQTGQLGDLNTRIENRGSAWADNAANRSVNYLRLVYQGDYDITNGIGSGPIEPYGSGVVTGRAAVISGDQNDVILRSLRFRQLQFNIPNNGYIAAPYA